MARVDVHAVLLTAAAAMCVLLALANHRAAMRSFSHARDPQSTISNTPVRAVVYDGNASCKNDPTSPCYSQTLLNDKPNGILHFVQVSDLHVSQFRVVGGIEHLVRFLTSELPLVAPEIVVATGDLTDAKDIRKLRSKQYESEWIAYRSAIESAGLLGRKPPQGIVSITAQQPNIDSQFWWDLRGNHDCFNVPEFLSPSNRYSEMSATKAEGFALHLTKDFGTYSFVGIDACPKLGITRPFNFFAYLDRADMDFLEENSNAAFTKGGPLPKRNPANHTFVMAHYPTATMMFGSTTSGKSFDKLAGQFTVWLSGHLHRLFANLGKKMYAYHDDARMLELEVADLKDHGVFRIIVVDNDMFSFLDVPLAYELPHTNTYDIANKPIVDASKYDILKCDPMILITNPRDSKFALPMHERHNGIITSTHIRVLVWVGDQKLISSVTASIDDGAIDLGKLTYNGKGSPWKSPKDNEHTYVPLWTVPWNPSTLDSAIDHKLTVNVTYDGKVYTQISHFLLDDHRLPDMESGTGGSILKIHLGFLCKELFVIVYGVILICFLLIPKLYTRYLIRNNLYNDFRLEVSEWLQETDFLSLQYYQQSNSLEKAALLPSGADEEIISPVTPFTPAVEGSPRRLSIFARSQLRVGDLLRLKQTNSNNEGVSRRFVAVGPFTKYYYDFVFFMKATLLRLCELSKIDHVWWPMYIVTLYFIIGPLFVGKFVPSSDSFSSRYGFMMLSGIRFLSGDWVPLLDTWMFAFEELIYNLFPIMLYLSFCVTPAELLYSYQNERHDNPVHQRWWVRMIMVLLFMYQIFNASLMYIFYGPTAVLIAPTKTWYVLWSICMFWKFQLFATELPVNRLALLPNNEDVALFSSPAVSPTERNIQRASLDSDEDSSADDRTPISALTGRRTVDTSRPATAQRDTASISSTSSEDRISGTQKLRSRHKK